MARAPALLWTYDVIDAQSLAEPSFVRVRTWEGGAVTATAVVQIGSDGRFSGTCVAGDAYTVTPLDIASDPTARYTVTGMTDIGGVAYAIFPGATFPADPWEYHELVAASDELVVTGSFVVNDVSGPLPTSIEYFVQSDSQTRWSASTAVVTNPSNGAGSVGLSIPVFPVTDAHAYLRAVDSSGEMIPVSWMVTGQTSTETYSVEETEHGGAILFQDGGGGGGGGAGVDPKYAKKKNGKAYYPKKIGEVTPAPGTNPLLEAVFCALLEKGNAQGAVPVGTHTVDKPSEVYCDRGGLSGVESAGQGIVVTCQRVHHDPEVQQGFRHSRVIYLFHAYENKGKGGDAVAAGGKSVLSYKWYQGVKVDASYVKAGEQEENDLPQLVPLHWDDEVPGLPAAANNSYPGQATGSSSTHDVNGMSDAPAVPVPTSDAAADVLAGHVQIPQGTDWQILIIKYTFETYLVCCTTDTVIQTFQWTFTVKIHRTPKEGGGHEYSSEVSTEAPTPVSGNQRTATFDQLAGGATKFPC